MARRIQRFNLLIWLINMAAFAAPFTFITFICWIGNIVLNIWMNQWWAHGNLFLMANTMYNTFQVVVAIPLIFEIPFVLKWVKPFRIWALFSGIAYNMMYLASICDVLFIDFIKSEPEPVEY